jgi:hypothetical protein
MIAPHTAFNPVQLRRLALDELKGGSVVVALRRDGLTAGQRHDVRSQRRRRHQPRYAESSLSRPAISAAAAGAPARRSARIVDASVAPRKLAIAVA